MIRIKRQRFGFYWVRFEGTPIVAEYVNGRGCERSFHGHIIKHWHIPGSGACFSDRDVCEQLSVQLRVPARARIATTDDFAGVAVEHG